MLNLHNQAQFLSASAARCIENGERADGYRLYIEAASLELEALRKLAPDKGRTRGILSVSAVAQLYKGRDFEAARTLAHSMLATPKDLPAFAIAQLYEALDLVSDEMHLQALGRQYADRALDIHLSGGEIYSGSAPADLAIYQMNAWQSLVVRVAELRANVKYRMRGLPGADLLRQLAPRLVAPTSGSFRFTVRFTEPIESPQQSLGLSPEPSRVHVIDVKDIVSDTIEIIRTLVEGNVEHVRSLVPDEAYRRTITGLVQSVTPGGKRIGEVKVSALSMGHAVSRISLSKESRYNISRVVVADMPVGAEEQSRVIDGNLRGAHLDKRWVDLKPSNGGELIHLLIPDDLANDVVAPMLDHDVRATIQRTGAVDILRDVSLLED